MPGAGAGTQVLNSSHPGNAEAVQQARPGHLVKLPLSMSLTVKLRLITAFPLTVASDEP